MTQTPKQRAEMSCRNCAPTRYIALCRADLLTWLT